MTPFLAFALLAPQQKSIALSTSLYIIEPNFQFGGWAGADLNPPGASVSEDGRWTAYSWMGALLVQNRQAPQPAVDRQVALTGRDAPPFDWKNGQWRVQTAPLALSPDGRWLARGTKFGFVVEEASTGKRFWERTEAGIENPARSLIFSPDGKTIAMVRGTEGKFRLWLFDLATKRLTEADSPPAARVWAPGFTADSRYLVASDPVPALFDRQGKRRLRFDGPAGATYFMKLDGRLKNDGLAALRGGRWKTSWIGKDPDLREAFLFEGVGALRPEMGKVDPSGDWYAAALREPRATHGSQKAEVRILRASSPIDVSLTMPVRDLNASAGGRWLLLTTSTTIHAVDTRLR